MERPLKVEWGNEFVYFLISYYICTMVITDRLKQIIFKHLYRELGDCEIIPYNGSIWFINRDNKHWYFELGKSGTLWWRYDFFNSFFKIFSMSSGDFCPVLSSWVEEVLNHKVLTTESLYTDIHEPVEDVLNHKVSTTSEYFQAEKHHVEEVLNHKVSTTPVERFINTNLVEEVLNHKVSTTCDVKVRVPWKVEEVLNHKVSTTESYFGPFTRGVEEVLNQ